MKKLLYVLTLIVMLSSSLIFYAMNKMDKEPINNVKQIVRWGERPDSDNISSYKYTFDKAPKKSAQVDTVVNTDTAIDTTEAPWIETEDVELINYAKSITDTVEANYVLKQAPVEISEIMQANTKTYMKFQTLGYDSWNKQGHLSRQKESYTGDYSIRMIDGRYLIALGTYYCSTIGTYIDVILEDGTTLPCILGDVKSNVHTDSTNRYHNVDKSVMEFIIDSPGKNRYDYSYFKEKYPNINGNFSNVTEFSSPVIAIKVYDKVYAINMKDTSGDNPDYGGK